MGKKIDYSATEKAQLTSEGKDSDLSHLQANGARALPSSPSASGWSADAIKRQLYRPSEIIFAWLLRLASAQLALAKSVDNSLDEETKRLDLDIAGLRDLIDDIAQHGIAKFDDDYNVIKDTYVKKAQIVNNVTSEGENNKPLGAGQGYVLQHQIDAIKTLLASDDATLDELQEIVAYIKDNRDLITSITTSKVSVSDIIDNLTSEIANKPLSANQGYVLKGLIDLNTAARHSHENKAVLDAIEEAFTTALKNKLDAIASEAQVNVIEGVQVNGTDLTPDANKKVNVDISGKLDKNASSEAKVYGVSNGNQTMWGVGQGASGAKLVQRTTTGQVNVPETPTANEHAASKKYVDDTIAAIKRDAYKAVDTTTYTTLNSFLATTGEEGFLYLYPIDTSDLMKGYYRYIWENSAWLALGTTQIDLSPYYTAAYTDTLLGGKVEKKTTTGTFVYTHDGNTEGEVAYTPFDEASTLVMRDANRQINIAETPTEDSHATSKKYVDTGLSNKVTKAEHLKALYHLGVGDSASVNNEITTITRKTLYLDLGDLNIGYNSGAVLFYCTLNDAESSTSKLACSGYAYHELEGDGNDPDMCIYLYQHTLYISNHSYTDATAFKTAMKGKRLEIESASSYSEQAPTDQPLSQLDQNGEIWLRGEYEKQLNLLQENIKQSDIWSIYLGDTYLENGKTYYLTISKFINGSRLAFRGTIMLSDYSFRQNGSFTYTGTTGQGTLVLQGTYDSSSVGVAWAMLTETDYHVPYQPYNGPVMHAIDVEGVKLWENGNDLAALNSITIEPIDVTSYSTIKFFFKYFKTERRAVSAEADTTYYSGSQSHIFLSDANQEGSEVASRMITLNQGQIVVGNAYCNGAQSNDYIIITSIYGIK